MKLLTIGNSFADNSTRYIKEIFADRGVDLYVSRANIGGCSLERHWNGAANKIPDYPNGKTLDEMIEADEWDYVTIQQASHFSWMVGTYYPYADNLIAYIKEKAPTAEILIQETWAYRADNERLCNEYKISQSQMFNLLKENYTDLALKYGLRILPVGEAFRIMQLETGDKTGELTRNPDGPSHANALGEYIGGMVWYSVITGGSVDGIAYAPDGVNRDYVPTAKKAVKAAVAMYNK